MTELSKREKDVLDFIYSTYNKTGYAPSIRDIREAIGVSSTSTIHAYIEKLCEKGYLKKDSNKSRSICPTNTSLIYHVPIIGLIRAGMPISAYEESEGTVTFCSDGRHFKSDSLFGLKITGNSMKNAGILDGDTVIVEKTDVAENGDIVVALIEDEATIKTFYKENGKFRLQPENETMSPIVVDSLVILGKVVSSIRYYI